MTTTSITTARTAKESAAPRSRFVCVCFWCSIGMYPFLLLFVCQSNQDTHYVDECEQCLLVSDPKWNDCVTSDGDTEQLSKKESELTTIIVIVAVVAFLIVIAAAIIIGALKKRQDSIKERFDSLASTYHHMDSMDSNVNFTAMKGTPDNRTKKAAKKNTVADHSDEEQ